MAHFKPVPVSNRFSNSSRSLNKRNSNSLLKDDGDEDLLSRLGVGKSTIKKDNKNSIDMNQFRHSGMDKKSYDLRSSYNQMQRGRYK